MTAIITLCFAALAGCGASRVVARNGRVAEVPSSEFGRMLPVGILLPPEKRVDGRVPLPVVYVLAPAGRDYRYLDESGLSSRLIEATLLGEISPAIFVVIGADDGCHVDWRDGRHPYELALVKEVIPSVEKQLGARWQLGRRHIVGVGMGALSAVGIALRRSELFDSATGHSGAYPPRRGLLEKVAGSLVDHPSVFDRAFGPVGDRSVYRYYNPVSQGVVGTNSKSVAILLTVGQRDAPVLEKTSRRLHQKLLAGGRPSTLVVHAGDYHSESFAPIFISSLRKLVPVDRSRGIFN